MNAESINWVFIIFPLLAMNEVSKSNNDLLKANILYTIGNIWSIFYFIYTAQWSWLSLYAVFTFMSIRGIITHRKKREGVTQ
jgi:hypothetical protein